MKKIYTTTILLLFAASMIYGQNLVTNPGFENWTDGTPDNWTYESGVTFSQENGTVHGGVSSAMVTLTTDVQGDTDTQNTSATVVAGDPFNTSVWVYDNDPAGRVTIVLYWTGGPANTYSGIYTEDMDAWQELTFEGFVPEGATGVMVGFRFYDVSSDWDGDAVFYVDDYSFEINTTVYPEPTNYPTEFVAESEGPSINLSWTDAVGDQLPRGYLILGNNEGMTNTPPVDGTPVANDLDWADGKVAMNVLYGVQTFSFPVDPNEEYTFTIFPYTNTGESIDYKTDGTPPSATATSSNTVVIDNNGFDADLGDWTGYSVIGEQVWEWASFGVPPGCAKMNGFAGAPLANEDWLISPSLNLAAYESVSFSFDHARNYASNEGLYVLVSTDYDGTSDPSANGTWIDLTSMYTFPDPGSWDFMPAGDADVTMYKGASTYFAFKYTSTDADASTWEVDNTLVSGVLGVGIFENSIKKISMYPNPATDKVSVRLNQDGELSLVNIAGQVVFSESVKSELTTIQTANLPKGFYMVRFVGADASVQSGKLLVK